MMESQSRNVFGEPIKPCNYDPITGFYRNGCCDTGADDHGKHTVCAIMTDEFLQYSKSMGNDLSTPMPQFNFPGLITGDRWCLCVLRWKEAYSEGMAPFVDLEATNEKSLDYVNMESLLEHAYKKRV